MKKQRTCNEYATTVDGENTVEIGGGSFEFENTEGFVKGDTVTVYVDFDKVELTDDEDDGTVGGNIAQTLYKGSYYQVQVYTDDDDDILVDTPDEWDIDDRVGILIPKEAIRVVRRTEETEEEEEGAEIGE